MKNNSKLYRPTAQHQMSRRSFIKRSSAVAVISSFASLSPGLAVAGQSLSSSASGSRLAANTLGFNGERKDPATGLYHLGNGYRVYNPGLMRFHAADSMSPFGKGGVNAYAYCLGDPVNLRDSTGHFAFLPILVGVIVGAVVGAAVSATAEGVKVAVSGGSFDWKQVAIGAAIGAISGGFGAGAIGAKTSVQVGLAVTDAVVSGAADFGLSVATGSSLKSAGINAGIGASIGLVTFGAGMGVGKVSKSLSSGWKKSRLARKKGMTGGGGSRTVNEAYGPIFGPLTKTESFNKYGIFHNFTDHAGEITGLQRIKVRDLYKINTLSLQQQAKVYNDKISVTTMMLMSSEITIGSQMHRTLIDGRQLLLDGLHDVERAIR
ncbi:RHS repeat-associated core domain-containing protein [Psychromonas aquimarina]|uniref:RHS repeat-associated core domain-containing protein n=1 Tax=Psychromonas aquimarina TaxID=444919 RepID=UPI000403F13F|nr:RHS repeat-associated core domain-containing protein [Psychromonas aquimarina]